MVLYLVVLFHFSPFLGANSKTNSNSNSSSSLIKSTTAQFYVPRHLKEIVLPGDEI